MRRSPPLSHAHCLHRHHTLWPYPGGATVVATDPQFHRPLLRLLGGAISSLSSSIHENQGETLNHSRSMQCGDSSYFRCLIGRWIVGWMVFWGLIDVETVIQLWRQRNCCGSAAPSARQCRTWVLFQAVFIALVHWLSHYFCFNQLPRSRIHIY